MHLFQVITQFQVLHDVVLKRVGVVTNYNICHVHDFAVNLPPYNARNLNFEK